ncbi:hypothetical protein [Zunongwangia atlantica]|uniref:Uncharacterized protein n=1 Tax=Zunongwangia atlantica 22II14-10F7 TaxID=1185767 RepID=A0A1Y1SY93_9FLAO|nr:hypothetical protein [Zunongwangia atlantica]ORL43532.1 hypothetical protein IIF7_20344 [Zunongwangia atlantica 22II14-10F7]
MGSNNIFNGKRFVNLVKQYLFHNYSGILLGVPVMFGISFLVIAFLQFVKRDNQSNDQEFFLIFVFAYIIIGAFYIGSAFPAFRHKEKSLSYLMVPGSALEKYLIQFIFYPLLYLLAFPLLYFSAYQLSSGFISIVNPNFIAFDLLDFYQNISVARISNNGNIISEINYLSLQISIGFSIAMAFFFGATTFKKFATLKTLFGLVIYIGLCVGMMYFLLQKIGWAAYHPKEELYLSPIGNGGDHEIISFLILGIFSFGLIFSIVAFLKIKEKEV